MTSAFCRVYLDEYGSLYLIAIVALLATAPVPQDVLIGDWIADMSEEGLFEGRLEVDSRNRVARFGGETLALTDDGHGQWSADLPHKGARISLRWKNGVQGLWLQRYGANDSYGWATPLRFDNPLPDRWTARVRPYRRRFPLLLRIERAERKNGAKRGALRVIPRDPDRNRSLRMNVTDVRKVADQWKFIRKRGAPMTAALSNDGSVLTLSVDDRSLRFRRSVQPEGLKARWTAPIALTRPMPDASWPSKHPRNAGFDVPPLRALIDELARQPVESVFDPMVHALLVAREGQLVVEEYFFGHGPEDLHDTRSSGKSLASMLAGAVAYARKRSPAVFAAQKLCDTASAYADLCRDPRKRAIDLGHLLSMRSGLACDDDDYDSPGNEDRMQSQTKEMDWYRYALSVPMVRAPGEKAVYCSAGINLSGAMLEGLTGQSTTILFQDHLATPLGIEHYHHNVFDDGAGYFGGGIRLRPRDMLK
ncbi:MAG: serine hydrolase domain-containing protein, partial [Myxococcota bacterium]